jgi:hypothetical protein
MSIPWYRRDIRPYVYPWLFPLMGALALFHALQGFSQGAFGIRGMLWLGPRAFVGNIIGLMVSVGFFLGTWRWWGNRPESAPPYDKQILVIALMLLALFCVVDFIWPAGGPGHVDIWTSSRDRTSVRELEPYEQGGKYGYRTRDGLPVTIPLFDDARPFASGRARVGLGVWEPLAGAEKDPNRRTFSGQFGYIDEMGLLVIPCEFDEADDFQDGSARVRKGERRGRIDAEGNWIDGR